MTLLVSVQLPTSARPESRSYFTQRMANTFPGGFRLRNEPTSVGQRLLNRLGLLVEEEYNEVQKNLHNLLPNSFDPQELDVLWRASVPTGLLAGQGYGTGTSTGLRYQGILANGSTVAISHPRYGTLATDGSPEMGMGSSLGLYEFWKGAVPTRLSLEGVDVLPRTASLAPSRVTNPAWWRGPFHYLSVETGWRGTALSGGTDLLTHSGSTSTLLFDPDSTSPTVAATSTWAMTPAAYPVASPVPKVLHGVFAGSIHDPAATGYKLVAGVVGLGSSVLTEAISGSSIVSGQVAFQNPSATSTGLPFVRVIVLRDTSLPAATSTSSYLRLDRLDARDAHHAQDPRTLAQDTSIGRSLPSFVPNAHMANVPHWAWITVSGQEDVASPGGLLAAPTTLRIDGIGPDGFPQAEELRVLSNGSVRTNKQWLSVASCSILHGNPELTFQLGLLLPNPEERADPYQQAAFPTQLGPLSVALETSTSKSFVRFKTVLESNENGLDQRVDLEPIELLDASGSSIVYDNFAYDPLRRHLYALHPGSSSIAIYDVTRKAPYGQLEDVTERSELIGLRFQPLDGLETQGSRYAKVGDVQKLILEWRRRDLLLTRYRVFRKRPSGAFASVAENGTEGVFGTSSWVSYNFSGNVYQGADLTWHTPAIPVTLDTHGCHLFYVEAEFRELDTEEVFRSRDVLAILVDARTPLNVLSYDGFLTESGALGGTGAVEGIDILPNGDLALVEGHARSGVFVEVRLRTRFDYVLEDGLFAYFREPYRRVRLLLLGPDSEDEVSCQYLVTVASSNDTVDESELENCPLYVVDTSGGAVTIELPDSSTLDASHDGKGIAFLRRGGNNLVIDGHGTTVNGAPTLTLLSDYDVVQLVYVHQSLSEWFVV